VKAPGFDPVRFTNDLAILELEEAIDLASSAGVSAACYPTCDSMFDFEFKNGTGSRCWVAGWGKDGIKGNFKTTMHKVDVPIVNDRQCENSLKDAIRSQGQTAFANSLRLHSSEICAGGEQGKDACEGDGGAPLVCEGMSGHWYVIGIVTWGVDCGLPGVPGVYARVRHFRNWIDNGSD